MRYLKYLLLLILVIPFIQIKADPPDPPLGKRWVLNRMFSDEFNGTELDATKWFDYHPNWVGREPGIFLPSQVSVADGYMSIRGGKLAEDTIVTFWDGSKGRYNIACGAVVSRTMEAFFGYYECRFKAAKTTMSTTFWMSTRGHGAPGPAACNDKYTQELDIQECIGREGDFNGSYFAKGMHSNSHVHYTDCDGVKHDFRAPQVLFESDKLESDTFNIYGGWWKNENEAVFYYNNGKGKRQKFYTGLVDKPFNRPMGVNLVSETYPFPWISLPTDEELADSSKNICYYDWVRAYKLIGVDEPLTKAEVLIENGDFETGDLQNWIAYGGGEVVDSNQHGGNYCLHISEQYAPEYQVFLERNTSYTLSCYGKAVKGSMKLSIKDVEETSFGSTEFTGPDYEKKSFEFNTGSSTIFTFSFRAENPGDEGYADDFELVEMYQEKEIEEETVMFNEKIYFSEISTVKTARASIDFQLAYMANADREINLRLFNKDSVLIGTQKYQALAGFGKKQYLMQLDSIPSSGNCYNLIADIRPVDSSFVDTFQTASYKFDLLDPVDVRFTILDPRNDSILAGASVTVGDTTRTTDQTGRVEFYSISPGAMPVQIQNEGYVDYSSDSIIVRNDTSLSIYLTPVSYKLTLYISDGYSGEALENAYISIDGKNSYTNYEGRAVQLHYSGRYTAEISLERYSDKSLTIYVTGDTVVYVGLDLLLANARFVIYKDSSVLAGAEVSIAGRSGNTSSVGLVNFKDLKTDTAYVYSIEYLSDVLAEDTLVLLADSTLRFYFNTPADVWNIESKNLRVFPNPASSIIHITGLDRESDFEIMDLNGRILLKGRVNNGGSINVSGLGGGLYFLRAGNYPFVKFALNNK